jgi:hypothetical protein
MKARLSDRAFAGASLEHVCGSFIPVFWAIGNAVEARFACISELETPQFDERPSIEVNAIRFGFLFKNLRKFGWVPT